MDGNGQTPMAGPAHAPLTPEEYQVVHVVLLEHRRQAEEAGKPISAEVTMAISKIGDHLAARAYWIQDARTKPMVRAPR